MNNFDVYLNYAMNKLLLLRKNFSQPFTAVTKYQSWAAVYYCH